MSTVTPVELNDGNTIPQFGFGVFQVPPADTAETVRSALEAGYRHIDTAQMYQNERGVGEGVRAFGCDRSEVFVTTKLHNGKHRPDDARRAFDASLDALGFDYVDLFLIHWPLPGLYDGDFVATWQTLEEFRETGRARSIGVSNFEIAHLQRLAQETATVPAVNQIEAHPYWGNDALREYGAAHGIVTQAWSPIAQGRVLGDPVITGIADRLGRTPAQVVLRWHLQKGTVVFPKTTSPQRMRENLTVFDFSLDDAAMAEIDALDRGVAGRIGPDPAEFNWIPD